MRTLPGEFYEGHHPRWDEKTARIVESVLGDFRFHDQRLASHHTIKTAMLVVFRDDKPRALLCEHTRLTWRPRGILPHAFHRSLLRKASWEIRSPDVLTNNLLDLTSLDSDTRILLGPIGSSPGYEESSSFGVLMFASRDMTFMEVDIRAGRLLASLINYIYAEANNRDKYESAWMRMAWHDLSQLLHRFREERQFSRATLAQKMKQDEKELSQWEYGKFLPPISSLLEWCRTLGVLASENRFLVVSVDITPKLLQLLKEDPERLHGLSPSEFERFTANRLDAMGFDVTLTGRTNQGDGGIDLIAVPKIRTAASFLLAGQMKHHRREGRRVGRADVDRLLAWRNTAFNLGLLVTNTEFSRDAHWLAMQNQNRSFLRLRDFEDLKRWLEDNFTSDADWREIPDRIVLTSTLTIEIPKPRMATQNPRLDWSDAAGVPRGEFLTYSPEAEVRSPSAPKDSTARGMPAQAIGSGRRSDSQSQEDQTRFVAIAGSPFFHRPGCVALSSSPEGRVSYSTEAQAKADGKEPCWWCQRDACTYTVYMASLNSSLFHRLPCPVWSGTPQDSVLYRSRAEAEADGKTICPWCVATESSRSKVTM